MPFGSLIELSPLPEYEVYAAIVNGGVPGPVAYGSDVPQPKATQGPRMLFVLRAVVAIAPVVVLLKSTVPPVLRAVRAPKTRVLPLEALIVEAPMLTVSP